MGGGTGRCRARTAVPVFPLNVLDPFHLLPTEAKRTLAELQKGSCNVLLLRFYSRVHPDRGHGGKKTEGAGPQVCRLCK